MSAEIFVSPRQIKGKPGQKQTLHFRLKNTGDTIWNTSSPYSFAFVRLGSSLYDGKRNLIDRDYGRSQLSGDCFPGDVLEFKSTISLPAQPGEYLLEYDLVNE